jgi:hypothetical protein
VVIPQARILNYAQSFATGHGAFAGSAEAGFKATDSSTGQLLAEWVDKRAGGMAVSQAAQVQSGGVESAMDYGRRGSHSARSSWERDRRRARDRLPPAANRGAGHCASARRGNHR